MNKPLKIFVLFALLYFFFLSIGLVSCGFKCLGKETAENIISITSNPFVSLFIGIFVTSLVQSSSTVTSMVVGFVGSGLISIQSAVPLVMGANVGTSVTNTFVSMGHITRKGEFKRAIHAATVHDIFNLMTILVLFPVEMLCRVIFGTGFLEKNAVILSNILGTGTEFKFKSPVKMIIKPVVSALKEHIQGMGLSGNLSGAILIVLGFLFLFIALFFIVKLMKSMVLAKIEVLFDKVIGRKPVQGLVLGIIITAVVQSSSITTSIMVPLAAAGVINIYQVLSITIGANIGTTVTALLASFAVGPAGVTIALVHLFFNLYGMLIYWPGHRGGMIPVRISEHLSSLCSRRRYMAFVYVLGVFFIVPLLLIVIDKFLL